MIVKHIPFVKEFKIKTDKWHPKTVHGDYVKIIYNVLVSFMVDQMLQPNNYFDSTNYFYFYITNNLFLLNK